MHYKYQQSSHYSFIRMIIIFCSCAFALFLNPKITATKIRYAAATGYNHEKGLTRIVQGWGVYRK